MAAHAHVAPAEVIFEPAIDPLGAAALVVAQVLGKPVTCIALAPRFGFQFGLGAWRAWIFIDDRHVTEITTGLRDLPRIIGAVHQVVEIGQAGGGQLGKRDRGLAVVQRGRGQQSADRDIAIGDIEMQLVTNPAFLVALGIALGSNRAVRRQIVRHLRERHGGLTLEPPRLVLDHLALLGPAALALRFRRHGRSLRANLAKAREKVDPSGTCPGRSQPHSRLNCLSAVSRSISIFVVGMLITALATNARANAARSLGGRPGSPRHSPTSVSTRASSSVTMTRLCRSVSGPSSSLSQGKRLS